MRKHAVIGIHGLNNKPRPETLAKWWTTALREGLRRNHGVGDADPGLELVYWADEFHKSPLDHDPEPYLPAPGTGQLPRHDPSLRDNAQALKNVPDKLTSVLGGGILTSLAKRFAEDLHRYHTDAAARERIRARLLTALETAHAGRRRIMLIAHSMGSIIAFDVLSALGGTAEAPRIAHLITIGSPLGLHAVKQAARRQGFRMQVPATVEHWTNLADRHDAIALDARLGTDYTANAAGVAIEDRFVVNGYVGPGAEANPHKIYGYLRTPELSERLLAFLRA
jgi:pimeloyl-ACP methyl ester carboxylesterase